MGFDCRPLCSRVSSIRDQQPCKSLLNLRILLNWSLFLAFRASLSALQLRAGSSYHASGGTLHSLSTGYIHGSYSTSTLDYDIAVLQSSSSFAIGSSGISIVALATSDPASGATLYVSGWGTTSVSLILHCSKTIDLMDMICSSPVVAVFQPNCALLMYLLLLEQLADLPMVPVLLLKGEDQKRFYFTIELLYCFIAGCCVLVTRPVVRTLAKVTLVVPSCLDQPKSVLFPGDMGVPLLAIPVFMLPLLTSAAGSHPLLVYKGIKTPFL